MRKEIKIAAGIGVAGLAGLTIGGLAIGERSRQQQEIDLATLSYLKSRVAITSTQTPTRNPKVDPTVSAMVDQAFQAPTRTWTPTPSTQEFIKSTKIEILGKGPVVPDSVWPGGVDIDRSNFSKEEANAVAEIYNGATTKTSNENNKLKLSAARAFAENIFNLRGKIDTNTMTEKEGGNNEIEIGVKKLARTSDVYYEATGDGLVFKIYEAKTPPSFTYNQIAASDKNPGVAFVNNGSVLKNEVIYVVYVYENGKQVNVLTFRGACGNIGSAIKRLPQPTPGKTVRPQDTPTNVPGSTPTPPERPSVTPVNTVTRAPSQPPQATRTPGGSGATPIVNTPIPSSAPIEVKPPTMPPTSVPSATPFFK